MSDKTIHDYYTDLQQLVARADAARPILARYEALAALDGSISPSARRDRERRLLRAMRGLVDGHAEAEFMRRLEARIQEVKAQLGISRDEVLREAKGVLCE